MLFLFRADLNSLVSDVGVNSRLTAVSGIMRSDGFPIAFQYYASAEATESSEIPGADPAVNVVIKRLNEPDGELLAAVDLTWDAGSLSYVGELNLLTVALNAEFAVDGDPDNDEMEVVAHLAFGWRADVAAKWVPSNNVVATLVNNINRGPEEAPPAVLASYRTPEYLKEVAGPTGGGATKLDGLVTLDAYVAGKLVCFVDESVTPVKLRHYRLKAGTDAENAPYIVRPDDYATTTNEVVWELVNWDWEYDAGTGELLVNTADGIKRLLPVG